MRIALAILGLAACGGGGQSPIPDALPDTPIDMPSPPLMSQRLVMSRQIVPTNNTTARELALDIDGNQTLDNALGLVSGTFAGQGFDVQGQANRAIDRGEILHLISIGADDPIFGVQFQLRTGDNPLPPPCASAGDTVCRQHLGGTGSFDVAADSSLDAPLVGPVVGGVLTTPIGGGTLQLSTVFATELPVTIDLVAARVQATFGAGGITSGIIAGAVTQTELQNDLLPQMHAGFTAQVDRDCANTTPPACGCVANSPGDTAISLLDTSPSNCVITLAEVENNTLIQSLLAPDVTIDGQDAISIGIGFEAVPASFTP
jgi:hypothetical protein